MAYVFMIDENTNRAALYQEPVTTGSVDNPNSARNAPLNNPGAHMSRIRFHSDFDYYHIAVGPTAASVTFPQRNGETVPIINFSTGAVLTRTGNMVSANHTLLTHSLGYVPAYMVVSGNDLITPSFIIQTSGAYVRRITPYATSSIIGIRESSVTGASGVNIPATTRSYRVLVFRSPIEDSPHLFDFNPTTGQVLIGKGKFKSTFRSLRAAKSGDSQPFDISLGRTVDIRGGKSRTVSPSGVVVTESGYTGSFSGSPSIDGAVS